MPLHFDEKERERKTIRISEERGRMVLDIRQSFVPEDAEEHVFTKRGIRTAGTEENVLHVLGLIAQEARDVLGVTNKQLTDAVTGKKPAARKKAAGKKRAAKKK